MNVDRASASAVVTVAEGQELGFALTRAGRGQDLLDVLDAALVEALRAGRTSSVGTLAANLLRVSGSWPWPAYGSTRPRCSRPCAGWTTCWAPTWAHRPDAAAEAAHRRTELQRSGTFELAELILCWDRGRLHEIDGGVPTNPMVAAWTSAVAAAAAGRPEADHVLAAEVHRPEPVVWTSHGRLALLAHAVADRELVALVDPLERQLEPLAGYLAAMGQIGTVGPVTLALARLARLRGDDEGARRHLAAALATARHSGGASAELHCRLLAVQWAVEDRGGPLTPAELVELDELRSAAAGRGMSGSVRRIDEMPELPAKN